MVQVEKLFYTPEEVAQMLDVSVATVLRKARTGQIPAKKFERLWRFPCPHVDAWIEHGLPPVQPAEAVTEEPDDELDAETRAWLDADLTEPLPPYDWGPGGIPPVKPVSYESGVGFVVEEEA